MGSGQSKIKVLDIASKDLQRHFLIEPTTYVQPFRKFNSEYHKKSQGSQHQSVIKIKAPQEDLVISISQQKFQQIEQAYEEKTKNFEIQSIIFDQYYTNRFIYVVKDLEFNKTILIRQFQTYDSHTFGNIACELYISEEIQKLPCKNLLKLRESYLIENDDIKFENPKTQVFEFEYVSASLAQIIKYRRENNWEWTQTEFDQLVYDLCSGLSALHEVNICHNDIRPENIFYSAEKKCYIIGQYCYATKNAAKGNFRSNRGSKYHVSPQANTNEQYDFKKSDVYSLGSTLLCALYLCNPLDVKETAKYNSRFRSIAGFKVVEQMVRNEAHRRTISQIFKSLSNPNFEHKSMDNLIQSLRYKIKPKNKNQSVYKQASSEFFKRLGLWEDWRDQVDQILESHHNLTMYETAQLYEQLALIDFCQDQLDQATMNAKRAAKTFRQMGEQAFKEGDNNLALKNFKRAVDCSRYYVNPYDLDLAKSLICLSKAHAQKRQQNLSTTLLTQAKDLVVKQSSQQSILYSQMKIKFAQLAKKFFRFQQSVEHLTEALNVAKKMEPINLKSSKLCQAKALTLMAESQILLCRKRNLDDEESRLDKAQQHLNQSKNIYESLQDVDCHLELSQNTQILGLLNVEKKSFSEAKLCFEKALQMRRWYQQNKGQAPYIVEHAKTLSNLGRCERLMNTEKDQQIYKHALSHQEQALQIFRKVYGSDHNYYSSTVLLQMGQIYEATGQTSKQNQCNQCAKQILDDLFGEKSPYDEVCDFEKMLRN